MGSGVSFAGSGRSSKKSKREVKDVRRRNSLAFFLTTYLRHDSEYELQIENVKRDIVASQTNAPDPRNSKQSRIVERVSQGNMRTLREQVISQWRSINRKYKDQWRGDTLLHVCCREGYARMVEFMMNPRNRSTYDDTPLELDVKNDKGRTPLWLVFTPPTATLMGMQNGVGPDGEVVSVKPADIEFVAEWAKPGSQEDRQLIIKYLVEAGATITRADYHDFTPLHYAAVWGWTQSVDLLLSKLQDANPNTMFGRTPLHFAVEFNHFETCKLLVKKGAKVNAIDREGYTPLLCACENDHLDIAELLQENGADAAIGSEKGKTCLKFACEHNSEELVDLLLDHGVRRRASAFNLLQGEVLERISQRLQREEEEAIAKAKAAELEVKKQDAAVNGDVNIMTRGYSHRSPYGQWVPYRDKRTRTVFYYNKVSRVSQWDRPPDYVHDVTYAMKDATFGMSFYH